MAKPLTVHQLSAGILTGGMARRMQGQDKGLLQLAGEPLVAHTAKKLQPYTQNPLLISANRHAELYKAYGVVVADPPYLADYQGPLAGVLALLEAMPTSSDWLLTLPVDSPFLDPMLAAVLLQAQHSQPEQVAFFAQHERSHPLCLLLHRSTKDALKAYLLAGQRRVQGWLVQQGAVAVDVRHYPASHFMNLNEPADWQRAQELWVEKA